ncbi:MSHA biogenesis protein MshF [Shewanella donghaensis]|uniref:MSHA biogenesis protein MshF n=1 Tax=Shewanella donghaensis TaxID=238836 RepID=UPI001183F1A6|nr:MSHA biogenesis protein MshF [Shewanella donghaensis]
MQKQQQSESDLLKTYTRLITLTLVLVVIGVIGTKHFSSVDNVGVKSLELEHSRMLYVLAMVKSQWLSQGKPKTLKLRWEKISSLTVDEQPRDNVINMSSNGWPILSSLSSQGCSDWWGKLMASKLLNLKVVVNYQPESEICHFATPQSGSISYQVSSGRVIFVGGSD